MGKVDITSLEGREAHKPSSASGAHSFVVGDGAHALADHSSQIGEGVNREVHTFQVGTGIRLRGRDGPPVFPKNGDMWVKEGFVWVQSGNKPVRLG